MPSIAVTVVSASELRIPPGSPPTPYVEVEYAQARRTTSTAKRSPEPSWRETFNFELTDDDEMIFKVFLPGGVFIGKALLSFAKFGTDADLCFELGDEDNEVGGKLVVKVEPSSVPNGTAAIEDAAAKPEVLNKPQQGPKTRLSISTAQMVDTEDFVCALRVDDMQKLCDITGSEEYLFSIFPDSDVHIEVHFGGQLYGLAKLKGSAVLGRMGTSCWVVVSNSSGNHVGKVLLNVSAATPLDAISRPLDSSGRDTTELTIVVICAEGLPEPCDACVYLSIGDNDRATTRKEGTSEPIWNEKFVFYIEEDETLSAKVFDKEEFVAEAIVPVSELLYVAETQKQLEVKLLDRKRRNAGLLVLAAEVPVFSMPERRPLKPAASQPATTPSSLPQQGVVVIPSAPVVRQAPLAVGAAAVPPLEAPPGVHVIRRVVRVPLGAPVNDALPQVQPRALGCPPCAQVTPSASVSRIPLQHPMQITSHRVVPQTVATVGSFNYSAASIQAPHDPMPLSASPYAQSPPPIARPTGTGIYEPSIPGAVTRYGGRVRLGQNIDSASVASGIMPAGVSPVLASSHFLPSHPIPRSASTRPSVRTVLA